MKRRDFIRNSTLTTAGVIGMPYLLPSGRLFAATGSQTAKHVVMVLFAGGVRQQETVLQRYLADSQDINIEGNVLYNMLNGTAPTSKIVYGTTEPGQPEGSTPIPQLLGQTLQQQGTLFPELRFSNGPTGHYFGLSSVISGNYNYGQGLRQKPVYPTIFEYVRRHLGLPATQTWFIGNGIGNSTPYLNYSNHPSYGVLYGANFFAPTVTFGDTGVEHLSNAKIYHPEEQIGPIYEMKAFLDQSFANTGGEIPGIINSDTEKQAVKEFVKATFEKKQAGQIAFPPVADNNDAQTIGYACEVLKWFKPAVTVVNMSSIDSCHTSFTGYLQALHRCDHAVGHLWNYIQTQIPEIAADTTLIIVPEHGRNLNPNPILDDNDWRAFDHDSDANSRRVFALMVGAGVSPNLVVGSESNPVGDSMDCALTVADLLGIKNEVMGTGLVEPSARSLFERI